jgi:uncharacterized protein (DUF2235 family)
MKRIFICADGTWNRPEIDPDEDSPTNVLKLARGIKPVADDGVQQVVFYDWGIGSYYDKKKGGITGAGINKNIMDDYRFLVQNYNPGDEIYLFGFSRGAYTVRSLSGLMHNCGLLKRTRAAYIEKAFEMYRDRGFHPDGKPARDFRKRYAVKHDVRIKFVGVWDTVGALGVPTGFLGFLNEKHVFHDTKIGPNIDHARHALAMDEKRGDFEPTIWKKRSGMTLKQVWFAGVHCDVGGGYKRDKKKRLLSDIPMRWLLDEAADVGAGFEDHLYKGLLDDPLAEQHESYEKFYKILGKHERRITSGTRIHSSVMKRYKARKSYRPKYLKKFVEDRGWDGYVED